MNFFKISLLALLALSVIAHARTEKKSSPNKLLWMYRFYYLPYAIQFEVGKDASEVLPFHVKASGVSEFVSAEELKAIDQEWKKVRSEWTTKAVFKLESILPGQSQRILPRVWAHKVNVNQKAEERISLKERVILSNLLKEKPARVQKALIQLRYLQSFIASGDEEKTHFFVLGPHWCQSSQEYRVLFETYFKKFEVKPVVLHFIVFEDPQERIFQSQILRELFLFPEQDSRKSVPKFLFLESPQKNLVVYEDAEALEKLFLRYFHPYQGFLVKNKK